MHNYDPSQVPGQEFTGGANYPPPIVLAPFVFSRLGCVVHVFGHFQFSWQPYEYPDPPQALNEVIIELPLPDVLMANAQPFPSQWAVGGVATVALASTLDISPAFPIGAEGGGKRARIWLTRAELGTPIDYVVHFMFEIPAIDAGVAATKREAHQAKLDAFLAKSREAATTAKKALEDATAKRKTRESRHKPR